MIIFCETHEKTVLTLLEKALWERGWPQVSPCSPCLSPTLFVAIGLTTLDPISFWEQMTISRLASVINLGVRYLCFQATYSPVHKYVVPAGSQGAPESSTMKTAHFNILKCVWSIRLEVRAGDSTVPSLSITAVCLPHLRHWHSNWLFPFIIAVSVLCFFFNHCPPRPPLWFSADAQDRRKDLRKSCTTYFSHFAKRHSSVDRVVGENERELHATVRNASSSAVQFSGSRLKSHVLSRFQTRKTCAVRRLS